MSQSEGLDAVTAAAQQILQSIWLYLPQVLAAALLLLVGWLIARLLRSLSSRVLNSAQTLLQRLPGRSVQSASRKLPPQLLPNLIFWIVFLAFVAMATQLLGLPLFADWLSAVLTQVPGMLAAALVIFGGVITGQLARDIVITAAASAGLQHPGLLGGATQLALLALSAVIGLELLGLDSTFLTVIAGLIIGMIGAAIALSFGLGAKTQVSNLLAARDVREHYQAGERIRIENWEGTILDITPRAVLLDTREGRVRVPAHRFAEQVSVLVSQDDGDD